MKKRISDLKPGTPFKYKEQVYIKDDSEMVVHLTNGVTNDAYADHDIFRDFQNTFVIVCKRIRKSDIKERK